MKPLWLAAAVALAGFLVWRRHRLEPTLLAGGALAVVAMAVYGAGLVQAPNLEKLLVDLGNALGPWTYLLVGVFAFVETGAFIGLIAPGETAMLVGGLIAGQGKIQVVVLIGIAWTCAVAGDLGSFMLGRRLGRTFLVRHGPKVSISEERLRTVERFFDRHGGKAILIGRFVGLVRAIAPFLAGSSGLSLRRFIPYDVIGAGLWTSSFILLGYVFWQSFSTLVKYASTGAFALGTTIAVVVGLVWLRRRLGEPETRRAWIAWIDRQAERPLLRPVAAVLRPVSHHLRRPARFVWERLTPGDLGLEFTTLLAVVGVGTYAFVANAMALDRGDFVVLDQRMLDLAERLADATLLDVARVVTDLGSLPVTALLVLVTSVVLVWRGEWRYAVALAAGLALTYAAVHVTKGAYDRPRPASAVGPAAGSSFPSGHAAYSIAWIACAAALSRALPTIGSRFAFTAVGVAIAALVGLTRLYLRVHYLSDIVGGYGLGAAIFGVCGIAALVVVFLRENEETAPARAPEPVHDRA